MKITIRNPKFLERDRYFFSVPEFIDYEGEETVLKHVDNNKFLCLTTGLKDFPIRVIDKTLIVGQSFNNPTNITTPVTKVIEGSKGNKYVLTRTGTRWICTCPGFEFRQDCKHVRAA